jgi:hypothetical protein
MRCQLNSLHHSLQGSESLKEVSQVGVQTAGRGDEEGVSENTQGNRGGDHYSFLTILDNIFTVAEDEEEAGRPRPHSGDLQRRSCRGVISR